VPENFFLGGRRNGSSLREEEFGGVGWGVCGGLALCFGQGSVGGRVVNVLGGGSSCW